MMIDEAIARERQQAKEQRSHIGTWDEEYSKRCEECAKEHEQLAEWLEELKVYKKNSDICPICDTYCSYLAEEFENGYNKAIDDFVKELKDYFVIPHDIRVVEIKAEQLKEGVNINE